MYIRYLHETQNDRWAFEYNNGLVCIIAQIEQWKNMPKSKWCNFISINLCNNVEQWLQHWSIISGYYQPTYLKHVTFTYSISNTMLWLYIGINEVMSYGMYYCNYIDNYDKEFDANYKYVETAFTTGSLPISYIPAHGGFEIHYSIIYYDWDILQSNGCKALSKVNFEFWPL